MESDRAGIPTGHPGSDRDHQSAGRGPQSDRARDPEVPLRVAVPVWIRSATLDDPVVGDLMEEEGMHGIAFRRAAGDGPSGESCGAVTGRRGEVQGMHRCAATTDSDVEVSPGWPVTGRL